MSAPSPLLAVDRAWAAALPRTAGPGAFDWWYADARDARGDGLVLIWARRLPFFAAERPSLNLALYRGGRQEFWLLQQPAPEAWSEQVDADGFRVALAPPAGSQAGPSTLEVRRARGAVTLRASLDLPLPGDRRRLRGAIELRGPCALGEGAPLAHPHRWVPIAPAARLDARLSLGGEPLFAQAGPGYLDRNLGDAPLAALGVARWEWGRVRAGDRCCAWYLVEGRGGEREALLLDAGPGGAAALPAFAQEAGGRLRVAPLEGAGAAISLDRGRAVERGPFYRRNFGASSGRAEGPAIQERCEVGRIGLPWMRPLVRMRLHRPEGGNSIWAPLFTGLRRGRAGRLLRHWSGG